MNTAVHEYELILLLTPSFSEGDAREYVEKFKKEKLEKTEITFEDFWGKKTLAYTIKKENAAHYIVITFITSGEIISFLDEEICIDRKILRHLITRLEKNSLKETLTDREKWNQENLPEKKTKSKPEEKRASLRSRMPKVSDSDSEHKTEKKEPDSFEAKEEEKIDKAQFDKKLNELLDGDFDL